MQYKERWHTEYHNLRVLRMHWMLLCLSAFFMLGMLACLFGVGTSHESEKSRYVVAFAAFCAAVWTATYAFLGWMYLAFMTKQLKIEGQKMTSVSDQGESHEDYAHMLDFIRRGRMSAVLRWSARIIVLAFGPLVGIALWYFHYPEFIFLSAIFAIGLTGICAFLVAEALRYGKYILDRIDALEQHQGYFATGS